MVGGYTLGRAVPVYQVYSGTTLRCAALCNVLINVAMTQVQMADKLAIIIRQHCPFNHTIALIEDLLSLEVSI